MMTSRTIPEWKANDSTKQKNTTLTGNQKKENEQNKQNPTILGVTNSDLSEQKRV